MQPVTGNFTGYRLTGYHFTTLVRSPILYHQTNTPTWTSVLRWFTHMQMVTHICAKQAYHRVTSLPETILLQLIQILSVNSNSTNNNNK